MESADAVEPLRKLGIGWLAAGGGRSDAPAMGHYAVLVPAYTGHLNPMIALARALVRRGHRITIVAPADAESKVRQAALDFMPIAQREFPPGEWPRLTAGAGELTGFAATRAASRVLGLLARVIQRELPGIAARRSSTGS